MKAESCGKSFLFSFAAESFFVVVEIRNIWVFLGTDGDSLGRQIAECFMLMLQGFRNCEPSYLQTLYVQVEQKFCIEAILATTDSIQSRLHGAQHYE